MEIPKKSLVPWRVQLAPHGRAGCAAQPTVHSAPHTTKNSAPLSTVRGCDCSPGPGIQAQVCGGFALAFMGASAQPESERLLSCSLYVLRQALPLRGEAARPRLYRGQGWRGQEPVRSQGHGRVCTRSAGSRGEAKLTDYTSRSESRETCTGSLTSSRHLQALAWGPGSRCLSFPPTSLKHLGSLSTPRKLGKNWGSRGEISGKNFLSVIKVTVLGTV